MGLDRDLHELLFCHDCVIVPQWGGFLTHYRSARLDEARKLVHPPGKDVSFNRHLTRNDGLLVDRLAKREGLGFEEANARIGSEVAGWRSSLEQTGRLELPHIGIFYHDADRNLQFDPDKRSNFLKDAYGLRPVNAVPVVRIRKAAPIPVVPQPLTKEEKPTAVVVPITGRRSKVVWAAAASVAVLFVLATLWALRSSGRDNTLWSGFELPWSVPDATYSPTGLQPLPPIATARILTLPEEALGVRRIPLTPNDSVHITVDLGAPAAEESSPDKTAVVMPKKEVAAPAKRARFHVVGGCFADPNNAERFHAELVSKGYPAVRLPRYGELDPVAYGSYATRSEALEALADVRASAAASAWLLVR